MFRESCPRFAAHQPSEDGHESPVGKGGIEVEGGVAVRCPLTCGRRAGHRSAARPAENRPAGTSNCRPPQPPLLSFSPSSCHLGPPGPQGTTTGCPACPACMFRSSWQKANRKNAQTLPGA
ncbi:hypothetical protein MRX96_054523 [Rhipicephalus microplus]